MDKQPDQLVFDELFALSQGLGVDTYTFLPDLDAGYPFVEIGDTHLLPSPTKGLLYGRVTATVHVWHDMHNRKELSDIIGQLMQAFSGIQVLEGLRFALDRTSTSQIIKDDSTDEMLYHGILNLEFRFVFAGKEDK